MIQLTDYLYEGHTIIRILHRYSNDLMADAMKTGNPVDRVHASFLIDLSDLL